MATRIADRRNRQTGWIIGSIALHLVLLLAWWVMPKPSAAERELDRPQAHETLSQEKLQEAADKLREINRDDLEQRVEELLTIEEELIELHNERVDAVNEHIADKPEQALTAVLAILPTIIEQQAGHETVMAGLVAAMDATVAEHEADSALDDQAKIDIARNKMYAARDRAFAHAETWQQQHGPMGATRTLQAEAMNLIEWIGVDTITDLHRDSQIAQRATIDQHGGYNWNLGDFRRWTGAMHNRLKDAERWRNETKHKDRMKRRDEGLQHYYDGFVKAYAPHRNRVAAAAEQQALAHQREREVLELLLALAESKEVPEQSAQEQDVPEKPDLEAMSIEQLYAEAVAVETRITETYAETRAAELAVQADLPIA
nr:hypothetical protein [Planctomycetota bacterium]